MAELEKRVAEVPATRTESDIENLPALFGRLGDDVMRLFDTKINLVKVELKEDAAFYARNAAFMGVGALIAAIGFALVNVAIACFVALLFENEGATLQRYGPTSYGFGFLVTGIVYLVVGGVIILVMKNRMAGYDPAPAASLEEFRKDKQWLKNEV